jgi:hypothetical protein
MYDEPKDERPLEIAGPKHYHPKGRVGVGEHLREPKTERVKNPDCAYH